MARVDYTDRAAVYRRARTLPPEVLGSWRQVLDRVDLPRPERVLDVGAGPGGFLVPLAEWWQAHVVAVEPSASMRREAGAAGLIPRYPYVAANAESLPFCAGSVDWAWLSAVLHQFDDRSAAARELRRVVRSGGRVLVRGFFSDVPVTGLLRAFPGIERSAAAFPSTGAVVSCFEGAGFGVARIEDVIEPWQFDLGTWVARARSVRDTDSALLPLTDAEFTEGLRLVTEAHREVVGPIRSHSTLRLIVLEC
jgi:ubiquinone/menaquinone biosynthesis C-methylase UbiE